MPALDQRSAPRSWRVCPLGLFPSVAEGFDDLDAPVERITGVDVPMPYAEHLDAAALPQPHNVINAVLRSLYRNKH